MLSQSPFTVLGKPATALLDHYSQRVGPCTNAAGPLPLTTGKDEPTLGDVCREADPHTQGGWPQWLNLISLANTPPAHN